MEKNGSQQPSEGAFPQHSSCGKGQIVRQTDVRFAEAEVQHQPAVKGGDEKEKVRKARPFRPQGAQEAVHQTQRRPHRKSIAKALQRHSRRCHRNSLPSLPPARFCS